MIALAIPLTNHVNDLHRVRIIGCGCAKLMCGMVESEEEASGREWRQWPRTVASESIQDAGWQSTNNPLLLLGARYHIKARGRQRKPVDDRRWQTTDDKWQIAVLLCIGSVSVCLRSLSPSSVSGFRHRPKPLTCQVATRPQCTKSSIWQFAVCLSLRLLSRIDDRW